MTIIEKIERDLAIAASVNNARQAEIDVELRAIWERRDRRSDEATADNERERELRAEVMRLRDDDGESPW